MQPRATFALQVQSRVSEVRRERKRLDQRLVAGAGNGSIPPEVFFRLRAELASREQKLNQLSVSIAGDGDLGKDRTTYRKLNRECYDLFGECLAIFTTEITRSLRLDGGACDAVERLLRGLGTRIGLPWPHVAALAEAEFFGLASQVVRIRYPVSSVWDYPVAAHEFGHFAGPRWPSTGTGEVTGFQIFMEITNCGPKSYLTEYFADMFATIVMGPAYVYTCLFSRFDPAAGSGDAHPSDRERAEWILIAMEYLQEAAEAEKPGSYTSDYMKTMVSTRRAEWDAAVVENGGEALDVKTVSRLKKRSSVLWTALMEWVTEAACRDLSGAFLLRAQFLDHPGRDVDGAGLRIVNVLNAAWMLRMDYMADRKNPEVIEEWAHKLCMKATA